MALLIVQLLLAALCLLWIVGAGFGWRVLRSVPVLGAKAGSGQGQVAAGGRAARLAILVPASNEAAEPGDVADLRAAHACRLAAAQVLVSADPVATAAAVAPAAPPPRCEIVYVDDRSTDSTGALLDEFAASSVGAGEGVRVRALHVRELPAGWLGKTHALQRALDALPTDPSRAPEWVLLSDADVRLAPDALRLALAHAHERGLDHLVLMPQLEQGGLLRDATLAAFGRLFALNLAAVNDPRSRASVGVGAFNLMRRQALASIGDMRRVRLEVGDDMALGAALRRDGFRQGVASGRALVQLAWYRSVGQIVRGLEKGIFAYGGRCRSGRLYLGGLALLLMELAPWAALGLGFATPHWLGAVLCLLGATALGLGVGIVALGERWMGRRVLPALFVTAGGLIMAFAVARAGWVGARRGGVLWRGTLYPSALLREAMAAERDARISPGEAPPS